MVVCTASVWKAVMVGGTARRGRWHAGDIYTLLGPEKTSTVGVWVFGTDDRCLSGIPARVLVLVSVVGWWLVVG